MALRAVGASCSSWNLALVLSLGPWPSRSMADQHSN